MSKPLKVQTDWLLPGHTVILGVYEGDAAVRITTRRAEAKLASFLRKLQRLYPEGETTGVWSYDPKSGDPMRVIFTTFAKVRPLTRTPVTIQIVGDLVIDTTLGPLATMPIVGVQDTGDECVVPLDNYGAWRVLGRWLRKTIVAHPNAHLAGGWQFDEEFDPMTMRYSIR